VALGSDSVSGGWRGGKGRDAGKRNLKSEF
jgi:hypothetical protein